MSCLEVLAGRQRARRAVTGSSVRCAAIFIATAGCGVARIHGDACGDSALVDAATADDAVTPTDDLPTPPADADVDTGPLGVCQPTVRTGGEDTDALCSNGLDDDCNGYIDCNDYRCSRNAAVTVCHDAGVALDSGIVPDTGVTTTDAGSSGGIGPDGGTVDLLQFAVFGDSRPPMDNDSASYPSTVVATIMSNVHGLGAQFAVATGDYMFASTRAAVDAQLTLFLDAERSYGGFVFHGMGNHECTGGTTSNCPLGNETANVSLYLSRLIPGRAHPYFDWTVQTSHGAAHFISTAPNAWDAAQQTWLDRALAVSATYTFVMAHEPPSGTMGPGSAAIDNAVAARSGGVTLRLYGHTHEYRHISGNEVINGNAGAPLAGTGSSGDYYGFAWVTQRRDGNIVVTAYQAGSPPVAMDSWVVTPAGSLTH